MGQSFGIIPATYFILHMRVYIHSITLSRPHPLIVDWMHWWFFDLLMTSSWGLINFLFFLAIKSAKINYSLRYQLNYWFSDIVTILILSQHQISFSTVYCMTIFGKCFWLCLCSLIMHIRLKSENSLTRILKKISNLYTNK